MDPIAAAGTRIRGVDRRKSLLRAGGPEAGLRPDWNRLSGSIDVDSSSSACPRYPDRNTHDGGNPLLLLQVAQGAAP
jgi:hypothetical protein